MAVPLELRLPPRARHAIIRPRKQNDARLNELSPIIDFLWEHRCVGVEGPPNHRRYFSHSRRGKCALLVFDKVALRKSGDEVSLEPRGTWQAALARLEQHRSRPFGSHAAERNYQY